MSPYRLRPEEHGGCDMNVRAPVFALQGWYPVDQDRCSKTLDDFLGSFKTGTAGLFAGIVPHAGWVFSGRLAAWTIAALRQVSPELVFVFGGHLGPGHRPVCMTDGAWATPLGEIEVHHELAREIAERFDCVRETPESFEPDNTIELQLPIIKKLWPEARLVAVQVPPRAETMAIGQWAAAEVKKRGLVSVAIGSTDLTHYGSPYGFEPKGTGHEAHQWSKQNDRGFIDHMLALQVEQAVQHALVNHSACCPGAAGAAALFAKQMGASKGKLVDHLTSYEIEGSGEPGMWVGYAGMVF